MLRNNRMFCGMLRIAGTGLLAATVLVSPISVSFAEEVLEHSAATMDGSVARNDTKGVRGDAAAIAEAEAMVDTMGGMVVWAGLKSLHFVHEWYPWARVDSYIENEYIDLTGPRSRADRKSEINHSIRTYSPEGQRWTVNNGEFAYGSEEVLRDDLARAPFNFYRLVHGIAVHDSYYEIRFGTGDIPGTRRLEFYGPDRVLGGWIILNARKEPIVKATPEYRYTLGPLKRFGNLRVPRWGVYDNGFTRFEMISLHGDKQPPDPALFLPPPEFADQAGS
jgi:hypothetical protein